MRRKDREIKDVDTIEAILNKADVCRVAFNDKGYPYVVPMNFGYRDGVLYFHSAPKGRKIDLIKRDNRVAFEISIYKGPRARGAPCGWDFSYRCVMGVGRIHIITDPKEKRNAIDALVRHYTKGKYKILPARSAKIVMLKLRIENLSAKGNSKPV